MAGVISSKTGIYRLIIRVGWALATFGVVLLTLLDTTTAVSGWIFLNLPIGVATGILFAPLLVGVQAAARPERSAAVVGLFSFSRALGQSIGVALGGTILQSEFNSAAGDQQLLAGRAPSVSRNLEGLIVTLRAMPDESTIQPELVDAYRYSLRVVFYFMAGLCFLGLVLSFGMKDYPLGREFQSEQKLIDEEDIVKQ